MSFAVVHSTTVHRLDHCAYQSRTEYLSTTTKMARGSVAVQLSGLASNPYPRPKTQVPILTTCELCDKTMFSKDWQGHKNSKKHRKAEAKEKAEADGTDTNGFGGDFAGFTAETGGFGSTGDAFTSTTTANDAWASSGNDSGWGSGGFDTSAGTSSNGNNNSGGGDRACYGCGETGHQKRDCSKGGSGGGDRACFNCGEVG